MQIVFADSSMVYDGKTPEREPLGGSQSAVVYIARALAKRGCDVTVYNRCLQPCTVDGVEYRYWYDYIASSPTDNPDFLVTLRDPSIGQFWKGGGTKILLCQDWYDQPVLMNLTDETDHVFFVGTWQKNGICEALDWPLDRAWVVPNGIVPDYYNTEDHFFRGKRLFYSPTPFRGLDHLLRLYPRIRDEVPDSELHIYGGMGVYQDYTSSYDDIYRRGLGVDMPGVTIHGPQGQRKLAEEMEKCRVFAYPNTFPETCCTSAYEAMAAGNVVVTTNRAGLIETVSGRGFLIDGEPGEEEYDNLFVRYCVELLENDELWGLEARKAWAWVHNNRAWDTLVQTWIDNLELIKQRG